MDREQVLKILAANRERLEGFHVAVLWIFGSVARDEATDASDVDVLVEFEKDQPVGLFTLIGLQLRLEELLGRKVDLGTPDSVRPQFRAQVLKEAIRAA